jgi:hypothetical protein
MMTESSLGPLEFAGLPFAQIEAVHKVAASLLVTLDRLAEQALAEGAVFILPPGVIPGVTHVYGTPVVRADVEQPMVAVPGA